MPVDLGLQIINISQHKMTFHSVRTQCDYDTRNAAGKSAAEYEYIGLIC